MRFRPGSPATPPSATAAARTRQPSLLAGLLFDGDGHRMTPSHAVKGGTRYRYYVSRPLITKDQKTGFLALPSWGFLVESLPESPFHLRNVLRFGIEPTWGTAARITMQSRHPQTSAIVDRRDRGSIPD